MNDMLGATALTADNKPLEFPEASHIVKQFLDLAYDTPEPVSLDSAVDVARFCDKYFAPRVTKMLVQGLHTAVKLSPFDAWKVFGIASQIEDSHLAATAILHFGSGARVIEAEYRGRVIAHKPFSEWLAADVSNVTSVYLAMYVKAHQLWEQETGVNSVGHKSNLSQIAKLFSKHISPPMPGWYTLLQERDAANQ